METAGHVKALAGLEGRGGWRVAFLWVFLFVWPRHTWDLSSLTGIKPAPPAVEARSLNHWATREIPQVAFLIGG